MEPAPLSARRVSRPHRILIKHMSEKIFNPSNIHKLEDPERLTWLAPQDVIRLLNLASGMSIADIGAGSGFFAFPFARVIEPDGRLCAVDLQPEMLEFLRAKLRSAASPRNLELIAGTATATNLKDASCDLVFLGNVWHELDDHARVLLEMARILRPGGRVAILDWRTDVQNPPGPPAGHRIAAADTTAALQAAGWAVLQTTDVGRYSYLVIARVEGAGLTLPHTA
jgi:ubiquinone/menaquinone biosynthesis C-methylase UbiE